LKIPLDSCTAILKNGRNDGIPIGQDGFPPRTDKGRLKTMVTLKACQERMMTKGKLTKKK
jgi:hypothetical protein